MNDPLVIIRFQNAVVRYQPSFEIEIDGKLWPRQLSAVNQMITAYKECTRLDAKEKK